MKLNPPASSSDLEAAREIARRLHQRRRRDDLSQTSAASRTQAAAAPSFAPRATPPPAARPTPASPAPAGREEPHEAPLGASLDDGPPETSFEIPFDTLAAGPTGEQRGPAEPEPPSWDDVNAEAAPEPAPTPEGLGGIDDDLDLPPREAPAEEATAADLPDPGLPGFEVEDSSEGAVSPDEMVGNPPGGEEAPAGFGAPLGESPFDEPSPPSWDEIVENCREIAGAAGAMLIDPAGQVFAARGEWPEPGTEAIASRLVAMMERALRDTPTRSVSAPVGGSHLTAWRVPLSEGLVTAAFIAPSPLHADVRSAVDGEIRRGAGA
jgi:hypothetical protein